MSTIVDVARIAQVSVSTVSHVVNGTRPVRDGTRARVQEAIERTGYVQDASARALRRSRTDSLGLVVSDTGQPVFAEMVRGVEQEASAVGLTLLLANSAEDPAREARALKVLRERRVDGLILAHAAGADPDELTAWREAGVPVVLLDRLTDERVDQVGVENIAPMRALVRHMVDLGHRRIAVVVGNQGATTLAERYRGYREELSAAGLEFDPDLVVQGSGLAADTESDVRRLLGSSSPPSAILTASTPMAAGTLRAAADLNLRLPHDLAFATFDGPLYADLYSTPLTTVDQPALDIGRQALRLLLRRIQQPDARPKTIRLTPTITHRSSCCLPGKSEESRPPIEQAGESIRQAGATQRMPIKERKG